MPDAYYEQAHVHHVGTVEPAAYMVPNLHAGDEREESDRFQSLCGAWDFAYYPSVRSIDLNAMLTGSTFEPQAKMPVPGCWQVYGFDSAQYITSPYPFLFDPPHVPWENPAGIYRTTFPGKPGERCFLYFEGADSCLYAALNGHVLGYAEGPHNTAGFDVTQYLQEENVLTVCVLKWCSGSYLDDQDKIRLSGIFRDVYLLYRPETYLKDFFASVDGQGMDLTCKIEHPAGTLRAALFDAQNTRVSSVAMTMESEMHIRLDVMNPVLWSAEIPYLYILRIELDGEWIEQRIGLRTIGIEEGIFKLNGRPVKLLGVNRHDAHPDTGYVVSVSDMRRDLELMKRSNINCVRTAHYPNDPRFYQLCDEIGLYVVDEADMETHGCYYIGDSDLLVSDPAYEDAILDREKRLVQRDKNFTSVIIWSMGNESGWGASLEKASRWIREHDKTRLIHMESAFSDQRRKDACACFAQVGPDLVDMIATMYPSPERIDELLSFGNENRPLFLTEYCHAMGNSLGGMKEYMQRIFDCERIMGGCIWEWADHALRAKDGRLLYGGDFGEKKHNGNLCADGLVDPDRQPHSALNELRQAYAPVVASALEGKCLTISNRWSFLSTKGLVVVCSVLINGVVHSEHRIPCPEIYPLDTGKLEIPLDAPESSAEQTLLVSFERGDWEISHAYFMLRAGCFSAQRGRLPLDAVFSGGMLHELHAFGKTLCSGAEPVIWRAPLDNDRGIRLKWQGPEGENIHVPCMTVREYLETGTQNSVRFALGGMSYRPAVEGTIRFSKLDAHTLKIEQQAEVRSDYPQWLPRYGLCWKLPLALCRVAYYGLGPGESYEDKLLAAYPGWFEEHALDARDGYLRPQESGSHAGTYLVSLTDDEGKGLAFYSDKPFSFCIRAHSLDELCAAAHPGELPPPHALYLYTDVRMSGIGSASVGPPLPERYCIRAGDTLEHTLFVAVVERNTNLISNLLEDPAEEGKKTGVKQVFCADFLRNS